MEVGSEFGNNSNRIGQNEYLQICSFPRKFFLSGRTGLHFIGQEIKNLVSEIVLPEYCCGSMIAPFAAQGYKISFYNSFDLNNVSVDETEQAFLILDYFGFLSDATLTFISKCKAAGKIVIVDATQTAFSHSKTYDLADYIVASYRKWFDCLCAVVFSKNGFNSAERIKEHTSYTRTWRKAAGLKENYLKGSPVDKNGFLDLFAQANHQLDIDCVDYTPDDTELVMLCEADSSFLRKRRRENAAYLMSAVKKLSTFSEVQLIFDIMRNDDCPLFVPILVNENKRNVIRSVLIKNNIYCPIHWPIDQRYPYCISQYHKREISLICDQRYGIDEMKKQVTVLSQALILADD